MPRAFLRASGMDLPTQFASRTSSVAAGDRAMLSPERPFGDEVASDQSQNTVHGATLDVASNRQHGQRFLMHSNGRPP